MDARKAVFDLIFSHYWARAAQVAAHFGLPDLIDSGTDTVDGLARATNVPPARMAQFLRILGAIQLVQRSGERFELTERGAYLCSGTSGTLRNIARMNHFFFTAFTELDEVLRTGTAGYELSTGQPHFDAMQSMPDFAEAFDLAMNDLYVPMTQALVEAYDFGAFRRLLDVGGGNGEVLMTAMSASKDLTGCLFDLPGVIERARDRVKAAGLEDRCDLVGGSFFDPLPTGADGIFLRHVLHNWSDEKATAILRRCRDAIQPGGKVLIAEALIEEADTVTEPIRLDLAMLTYFASGERTLEDYAALAADAGLDVVNVVVVTPALSVIETRPKDQ